MCSLLYSDNSYSTFRWLETLAPLLGEGGQSFAETAGAGAEGLCQFRNLHSDRRFVGLAGRVGLPAPSQ